MTKVLFTKRLVLPGVTAGAPRPVLPADPAGRRHHLPARSGGLHQFPAEGRAAAPLRVARWLHCSPGSWRWSRGAPTLRPSISTLYVFCFQGSIKGLIERFRLELQVPLPTLQDIFEGSPRLLRAVELFLALAALLPPQAAELRGRICSLCCGRPSCLSTSC